MSWEESLLAASFRGVEFEVDGTEDTIRRAVATKEFPFIDGGNTVDLGRVSRPLGMSAIVYGDDYEDRLKTLIEALDATGAGSLVHPVFGPVHAQLLCARITHRSEPINYAAIALEFIESNINTPLFNRVMPSQSADAADAAADDVLDVADAAFADGIDQLASLPAALNDLLNSDLLTAIGVIRGIVDTLPDIAALLNFLPNDSNYGGNPAAFSAAIAAAYVAQIAVFARVDVAAQYANGGSSTNANASTRTSPRIRNGTLPYQWGSLATIWYAPIARLKTPLLPTIGHMLPNGPIYTRASTGPQPFLVAHLAIQQTVAVAAAATTLLRAEANVKTLTPHDISTIAADARQNIMDTCALVRATYPDLLTQLPITEPLTTLALRISDIAAALIRARPPLIERRISVLANMALHAFWWYGDHRRSAELLRLNPHVYNPNDVPVGTLLLGYAT